MPKPHEAICPTCEGKGCILSYSTRSKARRAENLSVVKSQQPGQLTMAARGRLGGRPKALTLADLSVRIDEEVLRRPT